MTFAEYYVLDKRLRPIFEAHRRMFGPPPENEPRFLEKIHGQWQRATAEHHQLSFSLELDAATQTWRPVQCPSKS